MAQHTQLSLFKQCTKCDATLPLSEFYRDGPRLRAECKPCTRSAVTRRTAVNIDAVRAYQATYRETHRKKARATAAAWREANPDWHRANQERWRAIPANRQSMRERARAFRLADPVRQAEYGRRYHALKIVSMVAVIKPDQLMAKLAYWGFRCWMCGSPDDLQIDHVKPLSKGGAHALCNAGEPRPPERSSTTPLLRPACWKCNSWKRAKWPVDVSGYLTHGRRPATAP